MEHCYRVDDILQRMNRLQRSVGFIKFEGASRSEFAILYALYERNGVISGGGVGELAEYLDVSAPAVSRMLKNMEQKDLILRETSEDSKRRINVILTRKGESVIKRNIEIYTDYISRLLSTFSDDEIDTLISVQDKLIDFMEVN